jgi:hypothetical protein
MVQSSNDSCVYINTNEPKLIVAIWVDDGIACSSSSNRIESFLGSIEGAFQITRESAEVYVGLHITRDRKRRFIHLDQQRYIDRIIRRYGHASCNPVVVPADPYSASQLILMLDDAEKSISYPYRSIVGSLQFAALGTRQDISYAVSNCARFNNKPRQVHVNVVNRILKYLKGTKGLHLTYGYSSNPNLLTAYCDADFAANLDDRKSRSGFVLMLNGGAIAWGSRKQSYTASSTTESEYVATHLASGKAYWLRRLLADLGYVQTQPTPLFCDNQSAIRLVHNPIFHKYTKHISIKYHIIREREQSGEIVVQYINTNDQHSNEASPS